MTAAHEASPHARVLPVSGSDAQGVPSWARRLRVGILVLVAVEIVGTAIELATLRHWKQGTQVVPWIVLGTLAICLAIAASHVPHRDTVVRSIALLVTAASAFGIFEHVRANYDIAPLDYRYMDKWATMSGFSRWWAALSESVGRSPVLAPAVLAQIAVLLALATLVPSPAPSDLHQSER